MNILSCEVSTERGQCHLFDQIDLLYRANAKHQPEWVARFICFRSSADLPGIGIAALRAEAFIVTPAWLQRR